MASPDSERTVLNDQTASEALMYRSARLFELGNTPYEVWAEGGLEEDPYVAFNLVPDDRNLPGAGISVQGGDEGDKTGTFYVGNSNLRYSKELFLPEGEGAGREIYDKIEGGIGPFAGYYMESQFPQGTGTEYGVDLNLGPFTLFGNQATSTQNVIQEADRGHFTNPNVDATSTTFGAHGSGDVGIGTLYGGANLTNSYLDLPQFTGQGLRPTDQYQRLMFNMGLSGDNFDIGGRFTDVRDVGTEPSLYGSYKWLDPLNLGGELTANADWVNPPVGESSANVGFRYTLPLGGSE